MGIAAGCGTTIRPGYRGITYHPLSEPGLGTEVYAEGFYWQWPWNDIVAYNVTWQSQAEDAQVLTLEDLHVATRVIVTFMPDPERLHELTTQIGPSYYEKVIKPPFLTLVRSEFARHRHNDLAEHSPAIEQRIVADLRNAIKDKPIRIDRVAIEHIQYDPYLTKAVSEKVATQQTIEQKSYELEVASKNAEIARVRARGEGDAIQIRAEGESRAIELRGDAQAKAQQAIGRTLTPAYLQYKAFDSPNARYYFVPTGKNGLPVIVDTGHPGPERPAAQASAQYRADEIPTSVLAP
ncbi:MAG: hypothetical protein HY791_14245 [Deltaproteobacteria bacterium]|nr:hypothetical protein [Deltaproteobacteria bacterium]